MISQPRINVCNRIYYLRIDGTWYFCENSVTSVRKSLNVSDIVFRNNFQVIKYPGLKGILVEPADIREYMSDQQITQVMLIAAPLDGRI